MDHCFGTLLFVSEAELTSFGSTCLRCSVLTPSFHLPSYFMFASSSFVKQLVETDM